jgi:hypothetical protein
MDGDPSPYPITELLELDDVTDVTDSVTDVTDSVTAETTAVYECDGCDGFLEDVSHTEDFLAEKVEKNSPVNDLENGVLSVTPVTPVTELSDEMAWMAYHDQTPYPNPKSDNVRSSQKRALAIREACRVARTKEDLSALRREQGGEFSQDELLWVYNWLKKFFRAEYNYVQATAKISQPGLL